MAITKNGNRQWPIVAKVDFIWSDLTDATLEAAIDIPAGATVVGGGVTIDTAFDSATSDSIDIGDGDDPNRYTASVVDAKAAGFTALDITGYTYTTLDTIDVEINSVGGGLSAGAGSLEVWYVLDGRSHEVMPVQA
jgi:hypothetical protein